MPRGVKMSCMHAGGVGVSALRILAGGFDDGAASSPSNPSAAPTSARPAEAAAASAARHNGSAVQPSDMRSGLSQDLDEVAAMAAHSQGALRPVLKATAAAVTLGTGASLGPEGPSVEIGTAAARLLGGMLRSKRKHYISLIAAGSGAGAGHGHPSMHARRGRWIPPLIIYDVDGACSRCRCAVDSDVNFLDSQRMC